MTIDNAAAWLGLAARHRTAALIAGGLVVAVLLVLARVSRNQRRRSAALTFAAAAIALGFSAEGMWEVATGALHLAKWQAVLLFAFAEILMLFEADQARKKIADQRDPSRHIRAVWVIALVAALAAASHADNASGQVVRFFMPMAVAWQWASRIKDDLPDAVKQESGWIWTPQRIGVRLGLLKPGAVDDLTEVFRKRRITALVDAGLALYAQEKAAESRTEPAKISRWPRRRDPLVAARHRVQQLTKVASPADVEAARRQLRLTLNAGRELFRDDDDLDARGRQTLDDVRLIMRQATERIREDHGRAFGTGRREPLVELGGIRMPAHIAAQIGPMPAAAAEPDREPAPDSPRPATATQPPAQRTVTQPVRTAAQKTDDKKLRQACARLTKRLGREPTGQELADAAGVSKATANRWKNAQKES